MKVKKNLLIKFLTVLILSVLTTSCNDDETLQNSDNIATKSEVIITVISKEEIQQNEKIVKKLNIINELLSEKRRDPIYSDEYDMTIETDYAELIENEDGTVQSYTFSVTREVDNGLVENFVLTLQEDDSYKAHYISYNISQEELQQIDSGVQVDLSDRVEIVEVTDEFLINQVLDTREEGHWELQTTVTEESYWDPIWHEWRFYYVIVENWVWVSGSNPLNDTGGVPDNADGTGSNVGGSSSGGAKPSTRPQDQNQLQFSSFKKDLPRNLANLLNPLLNQQLFDFFEENGFSDATEGFALLALEAILNGNEVDLDERIIYDWDEDKDCQKQILKDLIALSSPFTELINNTFSSSDNVNIKFSSQDNLGGNAVTSTHYFGTPDNFTLFIIFDNDFLENSTDLGIAASFLHELVHAHFLNLYLTGGLEANSEEYEDLLNGFVSFYADPSQDTFNVLEESIHDAMNDFISQMANSLYNYASANEIDGVTAEYAEQLAWGTMSGYGLFEEMLTEQEQITNNNIYAYEQDNLQDQGAKGSPCD